MEFVIQKFLRPIVTHKKIIYGTLAIVLSVALSFLVLMLTSHYVTVFDGEKSNSFKTLALSVGEALIENGYSISSADTVVPNVESKLFGNVNVYITRAKDVSIAIDGKTIISKTACTNVTDLLKQLDISLSPTDKVNVALDNGITDGMNIKITRYSEKIITENVNVSYNTVKSFSTDLDKGVSRIKQKGQNGIIQKKYKITYKDNVLQSKELVDIVTLQKPINCIVEQGMRMYAMSSRGESFRYKKVVSMRATAYDLTYASCGKNPGDKDYGYTATGMKARVGVVAVDPRVIPLYSRLYIEAENGSWTYGYAVAGDTGSAIKGNLIDLFFNSPSEVDSFGTRKAKVYILE